MANKKDLSQGEDIRGDYALFIEQRHFNSGGDLDNTTKQYIRQSFSDEQFFRVIKNGVQQSGHGWVDSNGEIFQWG
jgi:hypothetical protein